MAATCGEEQAAADAAAAKGKAVPLLLAAPLRSAVETASPSMDLAPPADKAAAKAAALSAGVHVAAAHTAAA